MNTVKKLVIAAAIVPAILGSVSVWAAGGPGRDCGPQGAPMGGPGLGFDRGIVRMLNLTPEQFDKIRVIRREMRDEMYDQMQANRQHMQAYHQEQNALLLAKDFDAAKANELAKKMVNDQVANRVEMMKLRHKMLSVLTPEQKTKWADLMKDGGMNPPFDGNCQMMKGDSHHRPDFRNDRNGPGNW